MREQEPEPIDGRRRGATGRQQQSVNKQLKQEETGGDGKKGETNEEDKKKKKKEKGEGKDKAGKRSKGKGGKYIKEAKLTATGDIVFMKKIIQFEPKKATQTELRHLRDMRHENLCTFCGFYQDISLSGLLFTYCQRGSHSVRKCGR